MSKDCKNPDCKNKTLAGRTECSPCRYSRYKLENQLRISYDSLKCSAKNRNKEFTLTREEHAEFCARTKYLDIKGIYKDCYHIDRINEELGYTKDNIQVLKNPDNVKKYRKFIDRTPDNVVIFKTITYKDQEYNAEECPF